MYCMSESPLKRNKILPTVGGPAVFNKFDS